jgi:ribonuclease T2
MAGKFLRILAVIGLTAGGVAPALAQALACQVPSMLPNPEQSSSRDIKRRDVPVGGYRLALSWSPEFCRNRGGGGDALQCGAGAGTGAIGRFGFILHGLWPQGKGASWPQFCRSVEPVPEPVVRQTLCTSPSIKLIQHEWAKHGSCMARSPDAYFRAGRTLFNAYRAPDMMALSRGPLTVAGVQQAFARRNPGLNPRAISVQVNRRGWLEEVAICLDTNFRNRPCPKWEQGASGSENVKVWRGR